MQERKFIAMMVLVGLAGGVLLHVFDQAPFVIAIFLGTGVASLVYGFLGGIDDARFDLGPVKMGGSLAALVGVAWLANAKLEDQTRLHLDRDFDPPARTWFAMDRITSLPIDVSVPRAQASIGAPEADEFRARTLGLQVSENTVFAVAEDRPDFIVGYLKQEELQGAGFFNAFERDVKGFIVTSELPPLKSVDLNPLDLQLTSRTYSNEYSRYVLVSGEGEDVFEGAIYRRGAQIAEINGHRYIVMVVNVNHEVAEPFAKFAVGEIVPALMAGS